MKTLIISAIICLFFLSSCFTQVPLTYEKANNNPTYDVQYLFEHEGCKVYRFYDMGHYVYYTNCYGDVTSISNDSTATRVENHIDLRELKK